MFLEPINSARSFEEALVRYRQHLRQLLYEQGVMSNPGVDDDWIILKLRELLIQKDARRKAHTK